MDVWDEAVQFLLVGDRARQLAEQHPWTARACVRASSVDDVTDVALLDGSPPHTINELDRATLCTAPARAPLYGPGPRAEREESR